MAGTNINETNSRCEVNESDSIPMVRVLLVEEEASGKHWHYY